MKENLKNRIATALDSVVPNKNSKKLTTETLSNILKAAKFNLSEEQLKGIGDIILIRNSKKTHKEQNSVEFIIDVLTEKFGTLDNLEKKLEEPEVKEPEVKEPEVKEPEVKEPEVEVDLKKCAKLYDDFVTAKDGEKIDFTVARNNFVNSFTSEIKETEKQAKIAKYAGKVFDLTNKFYGGLPSTDDKNKGKDMNSDETLKRSWTALITYVVTLGLGYVVDKMFNISQSEQAKTAKSYMQKINEEKKAAAEKPVEIGK